MEDNDKDNNDYKIISALELDRDTGFSRGHQGNQGHWPHDDDNKEEDNNKDDNDDKGISALELDRDLGFLGGHQECQGHWPHADDNDQEEDDEVEDNDKDDDNNRDGINDKGISALGLERDLGFSRGHQGRQGRRPHDDDDN